MQSDGINKFRKKIKSYKNPEIIGITVGELTSIAPVTISVIYGDTEFPYVKLKSLIDLSGLKKEDIGKKYTVITTDNQVLWIIGEEPYTYKELYIEA